jgi:hypothetical protein
MVERARDVFVNCAFDAGFRPLFYAIVFAVTRSGFIARCALEADDSAETRFVKIQRIVEECRFGIHDISRTQLDGLPPLPRFNMPLELGLFLGARRYGSPAQRRKRLLILDTEQYRYQRFVSDLAGQDIHAHADRTDLAIERVATWLRIQSDSTTVPGGKRIVEEFDAFQLALPQALEDRRLQPDEMTFGDYVAVAAGYIDTL